MHEIKVVDESFDIKFATQYDISIQVGLDGFSFCILDPLRNKIVLFRHIPLIVGKLQFLTKKVETIFDEEEILNSNFNEVIVTYSTHKATLIPTKYSDSELLNQIANFTQTLSRLEEVGSDKIHGFKTRMIYCYPKELFALFNRKYTDFKFRHKSVPLINAFGNQINLKKKSLLINFERKYIRMIAFENSDITLFNSFYYKTETDFLYYTLNICHSLLIDPEQDEIHLGGFVADDSGYVRLLKKYFATIHFLKPSAEFDFGKILEKTQKHQFVSLINSLSCE
ncbi:MAG: DUF3822 family protein [Prolixibacteraceae bacterium]